MYDIGYAEEEGETTLPQQTSDESDSDNENETTTTNSVPVYLTEKSTEDSTKEPYDIAYEEEKDESTTQKSGGYDNESNTKSVEKTTKKESEPASVYIDDKTSETKRSQTTPHKYVFVICMNQEQ